MKKHGYVTLSSRSVSAVLEDLDVSTDAAWSIPFCYNPKPNPNRSKWNYDISKDMKHFEMALFDGLKMCVPWIMMPTPLEYTLLRRWFLHPTKALGQFWKQF